MATRTMNNVEIYLDARTKEQWLAVTKVIPKGFTCVELGTNTTKMKVGDGVNTYAQLPYVQGITDHDILEFENLAAFPETGIKGNIYIAKDTKKSYGWSGTMYVELGGGSLLIDDELSEESENAVQNKVITAEFKKKIDESDKLILNCSLDETVSP